MLGQIVFTLEAPRAILDRTVKWTRGRMYNSVGVEKGLRPKWPGRAAIKTANEGSAKRLCVAGSVIQGWCCREGRTIGPHGVRGALEGIGLNDCGDFRYPGRAEI